MAKNNTLKDFVTGIASAIREKKGTTELINPQDFENEIRTIQTDPEPPSGKSLAAQIIDKSVTSVMAGDLKGVTKISRYAFYSCDRLTSIIIPSSVTSIGEYAFSYCMSLTSITIPDSVTSIGNDGFSNCRSLTSITIPDSMTIIGWYVFQNCKNLTNVTISDSVKDIGGQAFSDCNNLMNVIIGNGVTNINPIAFSSCGTATESGTTYMILATTPPTIQSNTFRDAKINKIIVPVGTLAAYKSATNWSAYADKIEEATE